MYRSRLLTGWAQMHTVPLKLDLTISDLCSIELSPDCDGTHSDCPQLGQEVAGCLKQVRFLELPKLGCCANCVTPARPSRIKMVYEDRGLIAYGYLCCLTSAMPKNVGTA